MNEIKIIERDPLYVVSKSSVNPKTIRAGKLIVWSSFLLMVFIGLIQALYTFEKINFGFSNWRPLLFLFKKKSRYKRYRKFFTWSWRDIR